MSFIKLSRFFLPLSGLLVLASLVLFFKPGPVVSIEFTGGTLMELGLPDGKTQTDLENSMKTFTEVSLEGENISHTRTGTYFVRIPTLTTDQHTHFIEHLGKDLGSIQELQYTTIGPTVGASLKQHAFWALIVASLAIMIFLAFSFRKIPRHLNPWMFGASAIAALLHDIIIILGIFTILSHYTTFQVDTLFVTALLSIMGHSVSDTIVIFDRLRETLFASNKHDDIGTLADHALHACLSRTFSTGIGMLIMLVSLFIFGSESIKWFMLALIIGTVIGMYSSYFIATPILVLWKKRSDR
jgi:preprotein translocase SecF subunit